VEINFLESKAGVRPYQTLDQQVLVADRNAERSWNLLCFDCWIFDSSKWSMYMRLRRQLIELCTGLAPAWRRNANDFTSSGRLHADFCMQSWEKARKQELQGIKEVQEIECAKRKAKSALRKLLSKGQPKGQFSTARFMPHALMLSNVRTISV
jgi:hypothetical protein